nr:hypothetical protein KitaXyl93_21730 [Kitasatospora sp. Xyl93]
MPRTVHGEKAEPGRAGVRVFAWADMADRLLSGVGARGRGGLTGWLHPARWGGGRRLPRR